MKTGLLYAGVLLLPAISLFAAAPGGGFDAALFARWSGEGEHNVVFSPFSLASALAMTAAGARGETADEVAAALNVPTGAAGLPEAFRALGARLDQARGQSPGLAFASANALFPQQSFALRPEFLGTVRENYGGEATPLDYQGDAEGARQTINSWVEERTANRIRDLIAPGVLTPMTRLTLVNAIYFKGTWATTFDAKLTTPAPFHTGEGVVQASLMQRRGRLRHAATNGLQAVEIPYAGGRFAMLVLLPDEGRGIPEVAAGLAAEGTRAWDTRLAETDVTLFLPRFTCTWQLECTKTLQALGIARLFDDARADLSGMAGRPGDLAVSAVVHKAFVEVAEEGTEAAAATAVAVRMTAIRPPERHVVFRADRPFAYLIRETGTGTVLFAGVVARP